MSRLGSGIALTRAVWQPVPHAQECGLVSFGHGAACALGGYLFNVLARVHFEGSFSVYVFFAAHRVFAVVIPNPPRGRGFGRKPWPAAAQGGTEKFLSHIFATLTPHTRCSNGMCACVHACIRLFIVRTTPPSPRRPMICSAASCG